MQKQFLVSLESLRGLAALSVCWIHCWVAVIPASAYNWETLLGTADLSYKIGFLIVSPFSGRNAVVLFFLLSGFVLASSLKFRLQSGSKNVYRDFFIGRIFRLMPAATLVTLLSALIMTVVLNTVEFPKAGAAWFVRYLEPPTLHDVFGALMLQNSLNPVYWSLKAEVFGSLIFPLIFWLLANSLQNKWRTLFTLGCSILISWYFRGIAPLRFWFCFPLGIVCYQLYAAHSGPRGKPAFICGLLMFCFASWLGPEPFMEDVDYQFPQIVLEALGAFLIICSIARSGSSDGPLHWKYISRTGRNSFSLFLIHFVILELVYILLLRVNPDWPSTHPYLLSAALVILTIPAAAWLAEALYNWVEIPGINLGKQFVAKLQKYE